MSSVAGAGHSCLELLPRSDRVVADIVDSVAEGHIAVAEVGIVAVLASQVGTDSVREPTVLPWQFLL